MVYNKPKFDDIEQDYSALTELACSIKKGLLPTRKEDSEVRIQVPFDLTSFRMLHINPKDMNVDGRNVSMSVLLLCRGWQMRALPRSV